jgi:hypothetical protein
MRMPCRIVSGPIARKGSRPGSSCGENAFDDATGAAKSKGACRAFAGPGIDTFDESGGGMTRLLGR